MKNLLLTMAAAAAALAFAVPAWSASPLAGWWPMWEGHGQITYDWSGNGNHGQLGSTAGADSHDPTWIRGGLGYALHFDGNDYVGIHDSAALQPGAITVAALVRGTSSPGQWRYVFSKGGLGCTAGSYGLYTGFGGGMAFYVANGPSFAVSPEAPASVWDGRWHLAAGTFDGTTVRFFLDGVEVGAGTPASLSIGYGGLDSSLPFIGAYAGTCDLSFTGDIAQLNVWNQALPVASLWQQARIALALAR